MNKESAAAAKLALKAYTQHCDPELATGRNILPLEQISSSILTEAPEDAVCSLVIDLMHYCEHEKIDWAGDISSRARARFRNECKEERGQ